MFELKFSTVHEACDTDALRREIADKLTQVADYIRTGGINWRDGARRDGTGSRVVSWIYTSNR